MADPVIKIKNLVKRFDDRAVLDGIDIAIPEGKITVIMEDPQKHASPA